MFVFGDLIIVIATILNILLGIYKWIIIIAALISWVRPDPYNPIVRFLYLVTDPVLRPIRRLIGHSLGPIDISPLIVIIVIIFVQNFLIKTLMKIGLQFGGG
ncbi:MAG: YggT family protein [Nitrospirae bacterium]|nr:YggT family protein [Nitrospirota bacterium]